MGKVPEVDTSATAPVEVAEEFAAEVVEAAVEEIGH